MNLGARKSDQLRAALPGRAVVLGSGNPNDEHHSRRRHCQTVQNGNCYDNYFDYVCHRQRNVVSDRCEVLLYVAVGISFPQVRSGRLDVHVL